jgi:integrase
VSLFKRGEVFWSYFYKDGVRHQYSTGTSNRRQAENIEAKLKEEVNNQRFQITQCDPNVTFGELATQFVASGIARPHHIYHLKFLRPFFGELPAPRLTKSSTEEFRRMRQAKRPEAGLKDATVNRDLSVLRHILYWAVDEQRLLSNPLARMKMARERRIRRQVLSVAEEQKLLAATAKNHLHAMIIAALDTGMRRGEITSQRWEDIDFSRQVLFVTRSKTPEGESREIPLSTRLLGHLLEHQTCEGLIFSYKGRPLRIVKRAWKTALKNAGIRHVRFHDLRHTFNTRLMEAGVMQEVRMALMGHSSGSKVHATYTHIELPVKREAIRKLEAWVQDQLKTEKENKESNDASTESKRSEGTSGKTGTKALEEKVAGRDSDGAGKQAPRRDRRDGGGVESQTQTASKV